MIQQAGAPNYVVHPDLGALLGRIEAMQVSVQVAHAGSGFEPLRLELRGRLHRVKGGHFGGADSLGGEGVASVNPPHAADIEPAVTGCVAGNQIVRGDPLAPPQGPNPIADGGG